MEEEQNTCCDSSRGNFAAFVGATSMMQKFASSGPLAQERLRSSSDFAPDNVKPFSLVSDKDIKLKQSPVLQS